MTECLHPITFDTDPVDDEYVGDVFRACALCPVFYNRTLRILGPLRLHCVAAWSVDFGRVARAVRDEGEWRGEEFVP